MTSLVTKMRLIQMKALEAQAFNPQDRCTGSFGEKWKQQLVANETSSFVNLISYKNLAERESHTYTGNKKDKETTKKYLKSPSIGTHDDDRLTWNNLKTEFSY